MRELLPRLRTLRLNPLEQSAVPHDGSVQRLAVP